MRSQKVISTKSWTSVITKFKAWWWSIWPKHVAWYSYQNNKGVLTKGFIYKLIVLFTTTLIEKKKWCKFVNTTLSRFRCIRVTAFRPSLSTVIKVMNIMVNRSAILQCNSAAHQITTQNNTTTIHQHVPTVPAVLSRAYLLPAPSAVVWNI